MPKSYSDVTRSGADNSGFSRTRTSTLTDSNTNFGRASLLFFVHGEASPLEGSTHSWVKLSSFEVRNGLLFIGRGDLGE
jgi:hypothetical protein